LLVVWVTRRPLVALLVAIVWFGVVGWSVSRGPGRGYMQRRIERDG
jgi:hypothetical protein